MGLAWGLDPRTHLSRPWASKVLGLGKTQSLLAPSKPKASALGTQAARSIVITYPVMHQATRLLPYPAQVVQIQPFGAL